ncbi:MAG: hypothetical protein ACP5ER_01300 [Candidatus Bathyarchaeales archaeon]
MQFYPNNLQKTFDSKVKAYIRVYEPLEVVNAGIFALFLFGILGVLLLAMGLVWEGVALLAIVASVLGYMANKRRCPNCNRVYVDSSYECCPRCGYSLKKTDN